MSRLKFKKCRIWRNKTVFLSHTFVYPHTTARKHTHTHTNTHSHAQSHTFWWSEICIYFCQKKMCKPCSETVGVTSSHQYIGITTDTHTHTHTHTHIHKHTHTNTHTQSIHTCANFVLHYSNLLTAVPENTDLATWFICIQKIFIFY